MAACCRDRWFVDATYVTVTGVWRYVYRAVAQRGEVIGVDVSTPRYGASSALLRDRAGAHGRAAEVVMDTAASLIGVVDELLTGVVHNTEQYANNRLDNDRAG